jgi:hypothetical protein
MLYICSMPNDGQGRVIGKFVHTPGERDVFAEQHDQPGRSVYQSVAVHKEGATRRCLETIDYLELLHVDIDLRMLATPQQEVLKKLEYLDLPFEIRDSGGGYHLIAHFKEPIYADTPEFARAEAARTALTRICCGDPAPDHSAALLRVPGTVNSKYDPPRLCQIVRPGAPIDLTEIETLVELYSDQQLFEMAPPKANGQSSETGEGTAYVPLDVDYTLENMPTTGAEINRVQPPLLRKLLVQRALAPGEAVEIVIAATMTMAEREGNGWTRKVEEEKVHSRMRSVLRRLVEQHWQAVDAGQLDNETPPDWLWGAAHENWIDFCRRGHRPQVLRNRSAYYIRGDTHKTNTANGSESAGANAANAATEPKRKPATKKREFVLQPCGSTRRCCHRGNGSTAGTTSGARSAQQSPPAASAKPPWTWSRRSPWRPAATFSASSHRNAYGSGTTTAKTASRN